ncbi:MULTISPECIES: hypothetical protein [Dictyoglomus]|jgi:hypothetical protein|uniref:Uncharacterized protein n=1 Tax=Dictyoglomus turgidum (strain DSM 6724 / Z-1310) TaxID=515635 RepID=B8E1Y5_DICTD|nr:MULTISPECIES: hypothetical protein [Dictyoglomus]ACK41768.1 conserved hypothetical protein [Dictyoglomus turgidum DSM 6724]PNV79103.1 MAG: hypothetical protein C0196_06965 [Dictyoglomus turgidum]HBU31552.1 hypothetical protein [Dictyoglomus sp.]
MLESIIKKVQFKFSFLYQAFPAYTCKICGKKKNFIFFIDENPICPECFPTFLEKQFLPLLISKIILSMEHREDKNA